MIGIEIGAAVMIVTAVAAGSYKLGYDRSRRNGYRKPDPSQFVTKDALQFVTKEECDLKRELERQKTCRKLDRIMDHFGIKEKEE